MSSRFQPTQKDWLPLDTDPIVVRGQEIMRGEVRAIERVIANLDRRFTQAVELIGSCRGSVVVTGIGKAGLIGKKIAASFSSTGTPSHFLHPAEAVHGDLGSLRSHDVVMMLSYSGETEEVTRLLPSLRDFGITTIAITASLRSTLGSNAQLTLPVGELNEPCPLGLAPSATTTAMLALGDALALVASEQRGFTKLNFARFHPGGSLGRSLTPVEQVMRPLHECRIASDLDSVRQVLTRASRPGRRTGAIMLNNVHKQLSGIFTDSDLARLLERAGEGQLDQPIANFMTKRFQTVVVGSMLPAALEILATRKISELPVVDAEGLAVGMIDVTDVMSMLSSEWRLGMSTKNSKVVGESGSTPDVLPFPNKKAA